MRSSSSIAVAVRAASPGSNEASAANEQRIVVGAGIVVDVVDVDVLDVVVVVVDVVVDVVVGDNVVEEVVVDDEVTNSTRSSFADVPSSRVTADSTVAAISAVVSLTAGSREGVDSGPADSPVPLHAAPTRSAAADIASHPNAERRRPLTGAPWPCVDTPAGRRAVHP